MPSSYAALLSSSAMTSACPLLPRVQPRMRVSCCVKKQGGGGGDIGDERRGVVLDRRDMLQLALGAAAGTGIVGAAMGAPVAPPELSKCHFASQSALGDKLECCPPYSNSSPNIVDYDFPKTQLRVRRAAHLVKDDEEYLSKYKEAVSKMKALPKDHPWNYYQQALIHCAYCNDAYDQVNYPGVNIQVHASWFFLPWHRYYLHFYERILGKLIDDETFTLPFWNFDNDSDGGMTLPSIFTDDTSSPIYNENRDTSHYFPAILDYKYGYGNTAGTGVVGDELMQANLSYMQLTFKNSIQLPELFMGDPLRAGEPDSSKGTGGLETIHNAIHQWAGPTASPHTDMGNFVTAARDSLFFCLHANVDRLWHVYSNFRGNRLEFPDKDWLDSTFLFCDEQERIVRVKVRDCLNSTKLRYTYEEMPLPWMGKLKPKKTAETKEKSKKELALVRVGEFGTQPRELGTTTPLRVMVARPKKNRSKGEKEDKVEILQVKDIELTTPGPARFDVYIAAPYGDLAGPDFGEFAGSFVKLPHKLKPADTTVTNGTKATTTKGKLRKTNLKLGITALLEDIDAEDADKLVVTLVPRVGDVTVGGVAVKLVQADSPRLV